MAEAAPSSQKTPLVEVLLGEIDAMAAEIDHDADLLAAAAPGLLAPLNQQIDYARKAAHLDGRSTVLARLGELITNHED